jgi:hypothetical protein
VQLEKEAKKAKKAFKKIQTELEATKEEPEATQTVADEAKAAETMPIIIEGTSASSWRCASGRRQY